MACRTASVKRVADKTVDAKKQLDKLENMIKSQEKVNKATFYEKMNQSLAEANITDAELTGYSSGVKTEYSSEFNIDAIAGVVTSSLKALNAATDPDDPKAYMSEKAIDAYVDVVNKVAEAAKSSSKSAASLSYSMNRLGPGIFSFIYSTSITMTDNETFGTEAVSTTALYYVYVRSNQSLMNDAKFEATKMLMDATLKAISQWIKMQGAILDDLSNDKLTFDAYEKKDNFYLKRIELEKAKMEHSKAVTRGTFLDESSIEHGSKETQELVRNALSRLTSKKGNPYNKVVAKHEALLSAGHYWNK